MSRAGSRYTRAFSEGLQSCTKEATGYGLCIKASLPEVDKGLCEKEFQALRGCMAKALKAALSKAK